ncbi:type II toxin-antitoxin system Phd/YefM family antitoxin [Pseudonocardia phyllosphaerae]|uniref:type II toxin-antitoxin system Phd/YefM family antitoxin n=1 Tax=Pseudonocardia phyllosphaerae TaxID=3390502 RepID=UPI00397CBD0C
MESAEHERIGIRELRQNASRYVAAAKAGRRVPVTEHGKLVAYLVPADEPTSILDRLEAAGQLRRGAGTLDELPAPPPVPEGSPSPSEVLRAMRDEERW